MATEHLSLPTTAAAVLAVLTHRHPLSRSTAVAAAATHHVSPPSTLLDLRREALAQQKTFNMTGKKVRVQASKWV